MLFHWLLNFDLQYLPYPPSLSFPFRTVWPARLTMTMANLKFIKCTPSKTLFQHSRHPLPIQNCPLQNKTLLIHEYSSRVFHRVDRSRKEAVGPDRIAAEWILRLGGCVKFKGFEHWNSNYNHLPSGPVHLEAIDAKGLAVTSNGLEHLDGLQHLQSLSMSGCKYLYDEDLSHCTGLSPKGLSHLTSLKNLKELNVTGIRNTEKVKNLLETSLPYCKISC